MVLAPPQVVVWDFSHQQYVSTKGEEHRSLAFEVISSRIGHVVLPSEKKHTLVNQHSNGVFPNETGDIPGSHISLPECSRLANQVYHCFWSSISWIIDVVLSQQSHPMPYLRRDASTISKPLCSGNMFVFVCLLCASNIFIDVVYIDVRMQAMFCLPWYRLWFQVMDVESRTI